MQGGIVTWVCRYLNTHEIDVDACLLVDDLPSQERDLLRIVCGGEKLCEPQQCKEDSDCARGVCLKIATGYGPAVGMMCSLGGRMPEGALCYDDSWCLSEKCSRNQNTFAAGIGTCTIRRIEFGSGKQ